VSWSPDESSVAYTAEVPPAEKTPAWCGPEALKDSAGPKSWRGQGTANEDWGELNTGKRAPAVYVLDLKTKAVTKVGKSRQGRCLKDSMTRFNVASTLDLGCCCSDA
jgi:acylaminoacyl-peptidase